MKESESGNQADADTAFKNACKKWTGNKEAEEKEAQDFHDFIQNLKPSDFKKFVDENPESDQ